MDTIKETTRDVHNYYVQMLLDKAKWSLRCCGTWPFDDNWLYWMLAFIWMGTSFTIIVCQHVFIYQNRTNFDYILGAYSTMFTVIFVCIKQTFLIIHRKEFKRLLNVIRNDFWPINSLDDDKSIQNLFEIVNKCFIIYLFNILFIPQVWMMFPFIDHLPGHRKMPIICWYPFDIDKSPIHEIVYLIIILVCLYMSLGIFGFEYIFFQFIAHLSVQYKLIRRCLRSINNKNIDGINNFDQEKHVYEELIFCVKHHIVLKRFYKDVAVVLNANNAVHITSASFALCGLMYLIQIEEDPVRLMKLLLYIAVVTIELAMYCFAGTVIEEVSMSIAYPAFECNWYETHPRLRLGLIRLIQMANFDPLRLSSYGMVYINNPMFLSVMKTAFSMSTLILQMRSEDD